MRCMIRAYGRAAITRSCARRSLAAETIFMALVICRVFFTLRMRRLRSSTFAIFLPGVRDQGSKKTLNPSTLNLVQNPKNHLANFVRQVFCFIKQLRIAFFKRACDFELGLQ